MDNIEKRIAQGYAEFADNDDILDFSETSDINKKLRKFFDGKIY